MTIDLGVLSEEPYTPAAPSYATVRRRRMRTIAWAGVLMALLLLLGSFGLGRLAAADDAPRKQVEMLRVLYGNIDNARMDIAWHEGQSSAYGNDTDEVLRTYRFACSDRVITYNALVAGLDVRAKQALADAGLPQWVDLEYCSVASSSASTIEPVAASN